MRIKMISLILGGGIGSRLYPLTMDRSKPAVPIGGKYRLIDIPISNCLNSGVVRMFVLTQFNSASLNTHIKNTYHFDLFSRGFVDILAAEQTPISSQWYQGTADAVRQSMHHLRNHDFDYILILSGDQLYQMNFELMAKYHVAQNADITIATIPVNAHEASGFGIMKVNQYGFVERFIEKPEEDILPDWKSEVSQELKDAGKYYLASMGIYVFSYKAMLELFQKNPQAMDFGKEIIPDSIKSGYNIASFEYDGYWTDVGSVRSFYDANLELTEEIPKFNLFDNTRIVYTRPRLLGPSKITDTHISRSIVTEGSIIHAKSIDKSIIGIRSRIGTGTQIKDSIIIGNDYFETLESIIHRPQEIHMGIGKDCIIEKAIVDKDCRIGNNVTIRGGDDLPDEEKETHCVIDGIVVLKKGAEIPSGMRIGVEELSS
jgi:glucose-1-phosphate adenylyltransferase